MRIRMIIIMFGPPGAGKGTLSNVITKKYGIHQISTGDLLREAVRKGSPAGIESKNYIEIGKLAPDRIVVPLLEEELSKERYKNGYILDGFPRTLSQAKELEKFAKIDKVIELKSSKKVIMFRLSQRRTCSKCNAIYHLTNMPPKVPGICDKCGGSLFQRSDDNRKTIEKRLRVYREQSKPLISYFKKKGILAEIDGEQEFDKIVGDIIAALEGK